MVSAAPRGEDMMRGVHRRYENETEAPGSCWPPQMSVHYSVQRGLPAASSTAKAAGRLG